MYGRAEDETDFFAPHLTNSPIPSNNMRDLLFSPFAEKTALAC